MVDYRAVKKPTALKARPATEGEVVVMRLGVQVCLGMGDPADIGVSQIDCFYYEDETLVVPIGGSAELKPWIFTGYIDPYDCRLHYLANLKPDQG